MPVLEHALKVLAIFAVATVAGGIVLARVLRARQLMWSWAALGFPLSLLLVGTHRLAGFSIGLACLYACWLGRRWHRGDVAIGADQAEIASARLGLIDAFRRRYRSVSSCVAPGSKATRSSSAAIGADCRC
jgi:hypothetical protein